jgi:hypothetical protein
LHDKATFVTQNSPKDYGLFVLVEVLWIGGRQILWSGPGQIRNMGKPNPDPDQTDTGKTGVTSLIVTDQATDDSLGNDDTKQHKNELK